jgi:hypothetical protein
MNKILFLASALILSTTICSAQNNKKLTQSGLNKVQEDPLLPSESSIGFRLNTYGWHGFISYGKNYENYTSIYFKLGLSEIKHPKEQRQSSLYQQQGSAPGTFYLGKQNNFYVLNLEAGKRWQVAGKARKNGVALSIPAGVALCIGAAKPYYLDLNYTASGSTVSNIKSLKYNDTIANRFLDINQIIGSSGLTAGFNELKIIPGIKFNTGLHFDFGKNNEWVQAIEVGLSVESYTKTTPIMVKAKNYQTYWGAYIQYQFGRRW